MEMVGYYLHRAFIINMLIFIPISLIMYFPHFIFVQILGYDHEVATLANEFLMLSLPAVFFFILQDLLSSYLSSCQKFRFAGISQFVCCGLYYVIGYMFIHMYDKGLEGVALSQLALFILTTASLLGYVICKNPVPGTFFIPNKNSFKGVFEMLRY
jgi:Na+-driven multidrug efflux pump